MKYVGFYTDVALPVKPGTKIRIKKGTLIKSMHPSKDDWYECGKTMTVTAHHVLNGISTPAYELLYQRRRYGDDQPMHRNVDWDEVENLMDSNGSNKMYPVENPRVVWAGTGGYWIEVDINDVEILDA
jgi:hypothetical protein